MTAVTTRLGRWLPGPVKRRVQGLRRRANHVRSILTDRRPKLVIVVYHRVLPHAAFNPFDTIVGAATFAKQLELIARRGEVISLAQALPAFVHARPRRRMQIVLTFDDGYRDNYDVVLPVLRRLGLPATFLLATDYLGAGCAVWDWQVAMSLKRAPQIRRMQIDGALVQQGKHETRRLFLFRVLEVLKSASRRTLEETLKTLAGQARLEPDAAGDADRCLTWDEVRGLRGAGMEIGAHGCSHRSLARLPLEEAVREIRESKDTIERRLAEPCRSFAFPFGSAQDVNASLIEAARTAGFERGLLNTHGYNAPTAEPLALRRIIMAESTSVRYLLG